MYTTEAIQPKTHEVNGEYQCVSIASILRYFENGRTAAAGYYNNIPSLVPLDTENRREHRVNLVVKAQNVNMIKRITTFGEHYSIRTSFESVGNSSLTFRHTLINRESNEIYAEGTVTMVLANRTLGKPEKISDSSREKILQIVKSNTAKPKLKSMEVVLFEPSKLDRNNNMDQVIVQHFIVRASEIDRWGHVNQAKYAEWFEDTKHLAAAHEDMGFENQELRTLALKPIFSMNLLYAQEVRFGERIQIVMWPIYKYLEGNNGIMKEKHDLSNFVGFGFEARSTRLGSLFVALCRAIITLEDTMSSKL